MLSQYLPYLNRRLKQNDFVLNCDSSEWKLPEYNSLQDNHLKFFFANPKVRTVLLQTGMVRISFTLYGLIFCYRLMNLVTYTKIPLKSTFLEQARSLLDKNLLLFLKASIWLYKGLSCLIKLAEKQRID